MKKLLSLSLIVLMLGTAACSKGAGQSASPSETSQTTEASSVETTEFTWNDSPAGTLKCYVDAEGTDDSKEIPLKGYKSGTDPVFLMLDAMYDTNGKGDGIYALAGDIPSKITEEPLLNITKDLNLPSVIDGIPVAWRSSDENLLENTGKVHRPHDLSRYLILEAHYAKGEGYMTSRYVLRIARDMYAGTDPDSLPLLAHDGKYHAPPEGTEGEWFVFDTMNQITRFDPQADVAVHDYSHDSMRSFLISGRISMPRIDTEEEAYLAITTLGKILHSSHAIKNLEFKDCEMDLGDIRYDYIQVHNGVPVVSSCVRVMSSFRRNFNTVVFNMLMIPDDFSTEPKISQAEVEKKFDIGSTELVIWDRDGAPVLCYHGYSNDRLEEVFIDAMSGKELASYSTIVT